VSRRNVRERWIAEVLRTERIGDACRVLLLVMARHMSDTGIAAITRDQLAAIIGRHPQRVAERISEARRCGLLNVLSAGTKARPTEYIAVIPASESRTDVQYAIDRKRTGLRYAKSVRNPRSAAAESERVPIRESSVSVSEHLAVDQGREPRTDHDDSRAKGDHDDKDGSNEERPCTRLPADAPFGP